MTPHPGQASFMEWTKLPLPALTVGGLLWLAGCQAVPPTTPNKVAAVIPPAPEKTAAARPALPVTAVPVTAIPVPVAEKPSVIVVPDRAAPASRVEKPRISLANGRFTSVTNEEWRAVPVRSFNRPNNPPSLLEDAMITSTLHTRLKSLLSTRDAAIQCRSTEGKVTMKAVALTPDQAVTALELALSFDKVREVSLQARIGG